jgi:hypothetical protein
MKDIGLENGLWHCLWVGLQAGKLWAGLLDGLREDGPHDSFVLEMELEVLE